MDYQALYEKRAKNERMRAIANVITGVLSVVGGVVMLKQLRDERSE
jgi:hypothetical protein